MSGFGELRHHDSLNGAARFTAERFPFRLIGARLRNPSQPTSAGAGCSQKGILRSLGEEACGQPDKDASPRGGAHAILSGGYLIGPRCLLPRASVDLITHRVPKRGSQGRCFGAIRAD